MKEVGGEAINRHPWFSSFVVFDVQNLDIVVPCKSVCCTFHCLVTVYVNLET
jgi:hypothetical protein